MGRITKVAAGLLVLGFVFWAMNQTGGDPRFARIGAVGGDAAAGPGVIPVAVPGLPGVAGAGGKGAGGKGAAGPEAKTGPTLGPPPSLAHRQNALEPGTESPVYNVSPEISRYANHNAVAFTRIHQILVEAGEGETAVAKKVTEFQRALKDMRRGDEIDVDTLEQRQKEVIIEVKKVLTGDEVESLVERLESELATLKEETEAGEEDELPVEGE